MASEDHVNCKGVAKDVPVCFESVKTTMDFLAIQRVSVELLIVISKLERLQTSLGHDGLFAELRIREENVRAALQPETSSSTKK